MKKPKMYFRNGDSEICYPLDAHIYDAKEEGLEEITLFEAIPDKVPGVAWCSEDGSAMCPADCCGKVCDSYEPRNGKNGMCRNRGSLYAHGNQITIKVNP